jgi:hypothetical protein
MVGARLPPSRFLLGVLRLGEPRPTVQRVGLRSPLWITRFLRLAIDKSGLRVLDPWRSSQPNAGRST